MARRGLGLGAGTRISIRGFANLLAELPREIAKKLEDAFVEAEDLVDFHSLSVPQRIVRRRLHGPLEVPRVTAESSILGGSVKWDRLEDPRIAMYEVQIDDVNVFANPQTFQIVDNFFNIENIQSSKFVRVRGVRLDGLVGNYSATVEISPTTTAPRGLSKTLYIQYSDDLPPVVTPSIQYGGDRLPLFYTVFEHRFYPDRPLGGMTVWGYVSPRLTRDFLDSTTRVWDRIRWKVNGITRMENYFCHATDTFGDDELPQVDENGDPMSFYTRQGYIASFGPFSVSYPVTLRGDGFNDPRRAVDVDASGAQFYWAFAERIIRPSRWDLSILNNFKSSEVAEEAIADNITAGATTAYLKTHRYNFQIPDDATITGIEAQVKRRSTLAPEISFAADRGEFSFSDNTLIAGQSPPDDMSDDRIVNVSGFGLAADVRPRTSFGMITSQPPPVGTPDKTTLMGVVDEFSWSGWISHVDVTELNPQAIFFFSAADGSDEGFFDVTYDGAAERFSVVFSDSTGFPGGAFTAIWDTSGLFIDNTFHHVVVRMNGGAASGAGSEAAVMNLHIDGVLVDPVTRTVVNNFGTWGISNPPQADELRRVGIGSTSGGIGLWNGFLAQFAVIDKVLTSGEINDIYNSGNPADPRSVVPGNVTHLWLIFPQQADVRDFEIRLIDSTGIRTDLDNKADTTETWPALGEFLYINSTLPDGRPLAVGEGITHDSVIGIGYQSYGGEDDLWGYGSLDKSVVEDPEFGLAIRARNESSSFAGPGIIDHVRMLIYYQTNTPTDVIDLSVQAEAVSHFYIPREMFGGVFNAVEVGEKF